MEECAQSQPKTKKKEQDRYSPAPSAKEVKMRLKSLSILANVSLLSRPFFGMTVLS